MYIFFLFSSFLLPYQSIIYFLPIYLSSYLQSSQLYAYLSIIYLSIYVYLCSSHINKVLDPPQGKFGVPTFAWGVWYVLIQHRHSCILKSRGPDVYIAFELLKTKAREEYQKFGHFCFETRQRNVINYPHKQRPSHILDKGGVNITSTF